VTQIAIREAIPAHAAGIAAIHQAAVLAQRGGGHYGDAQVEAWAQIRTTAELRELMTRRRFSVACGSAGPCAYARLDLEAALNSASFYEGLGSDRLGDLHEHEFRNGERMTCVRMGESSLVTPMDDQERRPANRRVNLMRRSAEMDLERAARKSCEVRAQGDPDGE